MAAETADTHTGGDTGPGAVETFNPWTVVHLVFTHLADHGLHPVLGEAGDPAEPAAALLRALGVQPGRNDETVTSPAVQDELALIRQRMFGEATPGPDRPGGAAGPG